MKHILLIALLTITSVACGCSAKKFPYSIIEPEQVSLREEVDTIHGRFYEDFKRITGVYLEQSPNMVLYFTKDMSDKFVAQCWMYKQKVYINVHKWSKLNSLQREYVLYHELGHCVLNIENHIDDANGHVLHLMNPGITHRLVQEYQDHREKMLYDLFKLAF